MAQDAKRCGRARIHASVGLDQLNGTLKSLHRDGWKIGGGLLIRAENDASIGDIPPIDHPVAADGAVAVVHQCRKPLWHSAPHAIAGRGSPPGGSVSPPSWRIRRCG